MALIDDRIQQVLEVTLKGRQNASKRSTRADALAAKSGDATCIEQTLRNWHRLFSDPDRMPVLRCDPSPMNVKRKYLTLACGHHAWSGRRCTHAACSECRDARTLP